MNTANFYFLDSAYLYIEDPENTLYEDLYNSREIFDFSKLEPSSQLFQIYPELINYNASKSGYLKIETISIVCAVFLGPKNYYYVLQNDEQCIRCRGIPARSLKDITLETYRQVIEENKLVKLPVHSIRSIEHQLYQLVSDKVALHSLDIARYYGSETDVNVSYPFGYHTLSGCRCLDETDYEST